MNNKNINELQSEAWLTMGLTTGHNQVICPLLASSSAVLGHINASVPSIIALSSTILAPGCIIPCRMMPHAVNTPQFLPHTLVAASRVAGQPSNFTMSHLFHCGVVADGWGQILIILFSVSYLECYSLGAACCGPACPDTRHHCCTQRHDLVLD